jgi:protein-disulfide isomerase
MHRALALLTALVLFVPIVALAADAPSRERIEQIIREYLRDHPEAVVDALRSAEIKRRDAALAQTQQAIAKHRDELLRDGTSPVGGNASGDVTVVEFFDYACPHCKAAEPAMNQLVREDAKVRVVYKELPILGNASVTAARAALAAHAQGKYQAFHDTMMKATGAPDDATVFRVASEVGLDVARLKTDMASPGVAAVIEKNYTLAQSLGITGTPAFVIGDAFAPGAVPLARLKEMVARARQAK